VHDELISARLRDGYDNAAVLDDILFRREAARRGYSVKTSKLGRPFTKSRSSALEQAKEDAKRLGPVFRRLWNKRKRHSDPSVVAILTEIWKLSPDDQQKLALHLSHKSEPENG